MTARRVYVPRPYAKLAMAHFAAQPRCALFAKPGMGKTSMVMTFLDHLYNVVGEDRPTLVLGPKRVATSVWPDESKKWKHLKGLEVVPIVGHLGQRMQAMCMDAQVFSTNYENLQWLMEQYDAPGKPAWPFGTVIADESTKLKSFRLRQGGKRAQALAKVAHTKVDRWINLTGTPAPNGLLDLWGQTWFLDAGTRLGRTYGAFESRFFGTKRVGGDGGFGIKYALPGADEQIHERLADICLTLDPADWFDMRKPHVNKVEVDLPPKAAGKYKEFEKELLTWVDGHEIEAFNAAAKTMKCLQLASGAVYTDDKGTWAEVHDAKLDALESLIAENGGEPILVAYHFKSDLARLKERFKDGVDLSTKDGMAAAKRGEGSVWFGHPAGMGHGVDGLQEHCATVCFFSHWWDLEQHDQFIERVGPMRQLQSGRNRPVTIHYIVARRTIDEVVVERRNGKGDVQALLLEYMKGKRT